ncbi:hypothetical protein NE237_006625 [Protea cynaroides]|uniref:Uncharacterized protein n=1 Tax=Protea cynaroides TaxID=273540 RepID=A0A9Q0KMV8_9MAGN|nr:hypothetical protein NE237_006625 [Protea cynaroides]
MESGHGSGSINHLKTIPEATAGEDDLSAPCENGNSPSSSDSSLDDLFHVDGSQSTKSNAGTIDSLKLDEDVQLAPKDDEKDIFFGDRSPKSVKSSDHGSQSDRIPMEVTVLSSNSSLDSLSVTQSPQIQVMGRSGEPDPYRIPASVFASKPTTPMEWSVTSNESLFSIHVGNNSFSRDNIFLMGRSGELGKSGEFLNFPDFPVSPSPDNLVMDDRKTSSFTENMEKISESGEDLSVTEAAAETVKEVMRVAAEDRNRQKKPPAAGVRQSFSHSHRSDGSGASINSFAFPILTGGGGRSSDSVKADSERQSQKQLKTQPKTQTTGLTPNAARSNWFPCFSCCPLCC